MAALGVLLTALWAMLPAYLPNSAAVVLGGGPPIDAGRTLGGRRLLGAGKTWRGLLGGATTGVGLAVALNALNPAARAVLDVALPVFPVAALLSLPLGAMVGDIAASFLKRRTGRNRGEPVPVMDQLDFVVGAVVLTALADPGWFTDVFTWPVLATVLVVTPVFHVGTNVVGYLLGLKDEPW